MRIILVAPSIEDYCIAFANALATSADVMLIAPRAFFKDRIMGKFRYADSQLAGKDYLMGKQFTVADGYLFVMLAWADRNKFDLSGLSNLKAYQARVAARPGVQAALKMEAQPKAA